jgi:hypothetical protein
MLLSRSFLLAAALSVMPAFTETRGAFSMESNENEPQPGVIRLAGVSDADVVSLDGEEIPASGLRRSRFDLLIAPGIYTLKVRNAETGRTCTTRVVVSEYRIVEPACARGFAIRFAD